MKFSKTKRRRGYGNNISAKVGVDVNSLTFLSLTVANFLYLNVFLP